MTSATNNAARTNATYRIESHGTSGTWYPMPGVYVSIEDATSEASRIQDDGYGVRIIPSDDGVTKAISFAELEYEKRVALDQHFLSFLGHCNTPEYASFVAAQERAHVAFEIWRDSTGRQQCIDEAAERTKLQASA